MIRIRGTAETRRCDADAVRSQVITWNPALTLCASYLPLPPPLPAPPPLSQASVLIASLVNLTRGTQGCPKIISFDKSNWHPNFLTSLLQPSFYLLLCTRTFSQHPLLKRCTPFFRQLLIRESFSAFFFVTILHLSLINANYSYRRVFGTSLLTLFGVSLFLWRRERLITSIAIPCFITLAPKFTTSAFLIYSCFTFKNFC